MMGILCRFIGHTHECIDYVLDNTEVTSDGEILNAQSGEKRLVYECRRCGHELVVRDIGPADVLLLNETWPIFRICHDPTFAMQAREKMETDE